MLKVSLVEGNWTFRYNGVLYSVPSVGHEYTLETIDLLEVSIREVTGKNYPYKQIAQDLKKES